MPFSTKITLDELIKGRGAYLVADVHGGGGGMALGAVLEGFRLTAKREPADGSGLNVMLANRGTLGHKWNVQASPPFRWRPATADVIVSTVGADDLAASAILTYAARILPAVVVADVAPGNHTVRGMATELSALTRLRYTSTVIEYNDLSLGGVLDRRRAFHVLSQVPFGVDRVPMTWLPVAQDAVLDLLDLRQTWPAQRLERAPTWYSASLRSPDHTVDGFMRAHLRRSAREWEWARPGQELGPQGLFPVRGRDGHWLTHREVARLMGFPDTWRLGTAPRGTDELLLESAWATTTPVHPARWVMQWVRLSLNGRPGPLRDAEIDLSDDWRPLAQRQWGQITS